MEDSIDYKEHKQPKYYTGKIHGYTVKDIVDDFQLGSWTAQAVQYILRSGNKLVLPDNLSFKKNLRI